MRIGFDVSQTGRKKAGCGNYADGLIRRLAQIDNENEYVLYPAVGDLFWDPECEHQTFACEQPNFQRLPAPNSFESSTAFWRFPGADFEETLGDPDIFHSNNFYCPKGLQQARLVYTLYDLSFLVHPEWTTEANRSGCYAGVLGASLNADWMVAISEHSRRHFLEVFPYFPPERTTVVYPASRFADSSIATKPDCLRQLRPNGFWLTVATIEPRKNHKRLLLAYSRLKESNPDCPPLVLVGGTGWMVEDLTSHVKELRLGVDVIPTGYIDDSALAWLYRNCLAFVYPSLFEGFGMPVLEAMTMGAPVIASNNSSIPEIVGTAGQLVDPEDTASIASGMQQVLTGWTNSNALRENARREAAKFSWDVSARLLLDVYRQALAEPARGYKYRCAAGARG